MKLLNFKIENYKSLKYVNIPLDDQISLFIGKNNGGKSNFVDALLNFKNLIYKNQTLQPYPIVISNKDLSKNLNFESHIGIIIKRKGKFCV